MIYFYNLAVSILFSCTNNTQLETNRNPQKTDIQDSLMNEFGYTEVDDDNLEKRLKNICTTNYLEFTNLYPNFEIIKIVENLKNNAFETTNWGRGNWLKGPRIVSVFLANNHCEC